MAQGYECWSTSSPTESSCYSGAINDAWGARGRTISVDGQDKAGYDKMIKDRFRFTQDNVWEAHKEAAQKGLPVVAIFGSWEHNNSRQLIQEALPQADPQGKKAVYIYIDPTKCPPGALADFAHSHTDQGHNAAISLVYTLKPDATGQPQPEPYTLRWQGGHPSMIPSFNQALDEAQRTMKDRRFASDAPPVPPAPKEKTPPPKKMDYIEDKPTAPEPMEKNEKEKQPVKEKEKSEIDRLKECLDTAKLELAAMKQELEALKNKTQTPLRPTSEKKESDFDLNSFLGGAASATAVALLARWIANRSGRGSEPGGLTDSKPPLLDKPPSGGELKPTQKELELVKTSLGLKPNASDAEVQEKLQKAVTDHIRKALNMENASDAEVLKAIKAADGEAMRKLKTALGLPQDAKPEQVFNRILDDLANGRDPAGMPKSLQPPKKDAAKPDELPKKDAPKPDELPKKDAPKPDELPKKDAPKPDELPKKDAPKPDEPSGRVKFSDLKTYIDKFAIIQEGQSTSAANFQNQVVEFVIKDKFQGDPLTAKMQVTEGEAAKLKFTHNGEEVEPLYRDKNELVLKNGKRIPIAETTVEAQLPKDLFNTMGTEDGLNKLNREFGSMLTQLDDISTRKDRVGSAATDKDLIDQETKDRLAEAKAAELAASKPTQRPPERNAIEPSTLVGSPQVEPKTTQFEVDVESGLLVAKEASGEKNTTLEEKAFDQIFKARENALTERLKQLEDSKAAPEYLRQEREKADQELAELRAQRDLLRSDTPAGKAFHKAFGEAVSKFVAEHGGRVAKGVGLGCSLLIVANAVCRQFKSDGTEKKNPS